MTRDRRHLRAITGKKAGDAPGRQPSGPKEGALRKFTVIAFAVIVLTVAGLGFTYKLTEFTMTIVNDDIVGFGVAAVCLYLTGLVPIIFLTLWAVFTGRFRDIEAPKFRLLELDREIERGGDLGRHHA